ncbi:guanine nucleotide-binding protein alpha-1 subunit [Coccidioides immitis RMSCC 3703]|nr:guanine nucleotide-binding protein alpha-1 subunit [Coccidioides immitis RMSCC 3703]
MGCSGSKEISPEERQAIKQNASIDKMIRMDKKTYDRTVKILLLGAGESGKSTIIKQMRIIHAGGFPEDERRQTRAIIYSNMIVAFKILLDIMEAEGIEFEAADTKSFAQVIEETEADVESDEAFTDLNVRQAMKSMWADPGVQKAVAKGHEFALHDNLD